VLILSSDLTQNRKRVIVLGSTGSVGRSTVDILNQHPEAFEVVGLVAHQNVKLLAEQARTLGAKWAVCADERCHAALREHLQGAEVIAGAGSNAVFELIDRPCDIVVAAIVGMAGLEPTWASIQLGRTIALANKECLVAAGPLFMERIKAQSARLIPVDSEHNALAQLLVGCVEGEFEKLILTASGGPFRAFSLQDLEFVTPAEAVRHPNWQMGKKISVDSATLMNKALELIEAAYLFGCDESKIDVLVHPQSIVHGMVEFVDGTYFACLGAPDMRIPLSYALGWPRRLANQSSAMDWSNPLTFQQLDHDRFPAIQIARHALQSRGAHPTILNAANEVAVGWFLEGRIKFLDIIKLVRKALDEFDQTGHPGNVEQVLIIDQECRIFMQDHMSKLINANVMGSLS